MRTREGTQSRAARQPMIETGQPEPDAPAIKEHTLGFQRRRGTLTKGSIPYGTCIDGGSLARPKEQASELLGFPTSRDHPRTWRVGWARTYVALSSRALKTSESLDVLVDPVEPFGIRR